MQISWTEQASHYKSSWPVTAGYLLRSRETQVAKRRHLREENSRLQRLIEKQHRQLKRCEREVRELRYQLRKQELEKAAASEAPALPADPPLARHGYGARMIALAVNLVRKTGLRAASHAIRICFEWLGFDVKTPSWTAIRSWLQRLGLAKLKEPLESAGDRIWMADHSNQIGTEKTLVILGIRAASLPEAGTALKHQNVRVLTVQPGTQWKDQNMGKVYEQLAEKIGPPRAVLIDGATELRSGTKCLKSRRSDMIVLRDFKHYAANAFQSLIGEDPQFKCFGKNLGLTRSAIQQTELAHLTPPKPKQKSRFMNVAATLRWGTVILWLHEHPEADSRQGITTKRFEEKLGWIREFRADLEVWQDCQEVLSRALTFINNHGVYHGASADLRSTIGDSPQSDQSQQLADRLVTFVKESEEQLEAGERLPMSTEILESSFSLYKNLEKQHAKGGFTSLLATFAALLKPTTPDEIKDALSRVSNRDVKKWVTENLGTTLASRCQAMYREYDHAQKSATKMPATT